MAILCQTIVQAQQTIATVNLKDSGIAVSFGTEMRAADDSILKGAFDTYVFVHKKNLIHRVLIDEKSGIYFGYDFEIEPDLAKNEFRVSIKPLSLIPDERYEFNKYSGSELPVYPDSVVLKEGETLELELLENPQTKIRIMDLIKVSKRKSTSGKAKVRVN